MSEYQYYEFLAIDRPLTAQEMAALRALSSRARITPVSFTNEYNWGDFKGNAGNLMLRYFDAHIYLANWGTAVFMIRLPQAVLDAKTLHAFTLDDVLEAESTPTHRVLTWNMNESEDYDSFTLEDGAGWMARLSPVREELLRGDLRSLYIGWLAAVSIGVADENELEPLALDGLDRFTAAQQALAEFLEVDEDLLAGVGLDRANAPEDETEQQQINAWLATMSRKEALSLVHQILTGQGQQAERDAKNRFAAWRRSTERPMSEMPRRTARELWELAEKAKEIRLRGEKLEREAAEVKRKKERDTYLAALAGDFPKAWKAVHLKTERGSGLAYDEACSALVDLFEAYGRHDGRKAFDQEMRRFMAAHERRKALVQRLVKVGLWRDG
jgi:hypothetical protein